MRLWICCRWTGREAAEAAEQVTAVSRSTRHVRSKVNIVLQCSACCLPASNAPAVPLPQPLSLVWVLVFLPLLLQDEHVLAPGQPLVQGVGQKQPPAGVVRHPLLRPAGHAVVRAAEGAAPPAALLHSPSTTHTQTDRQTVNAGQGRVADESCHLFLSPPAVAVAVSVPVPPGCCSRSCSSLYILIYNYLNN